MTYGETVALDDAAFDLRPGEVHALLGQNGSGKSTLVKVLAGVVKPRSSGSIHFDGERTRSPVRPEALRRAGISFVHQDLGLVESMSVRDNLRVGRYSAGRFSRAIRRRHEIEAAREALARVEARIDPARPVAGLSVTDRARISIGRAIQDHEPGRGVVILDEATRALPPDASEIVHHLIRQVAEDGGSVILVTHRLEEVLEVCDRATVLRDGRVTTPGADVTGMHVDDLSRWILDRDVDRARLRPITVHTTGTGEESCGARIEGLRGPTVHDVDLTIGAGEVVGITGVTGAGFEELPYLLSGAVRAAAGTLHLGGRAIPLAKASLRTLIASGVALIPESRATLGVAAGRSILENVTLPRVATNGRPYAIGRAWQRDEVDAVIERFSIVTRGPDQHVSELSGGNQQKVLMGKWVLQAPDFLVAHEPTQGVDVGARRELLAAIAEVASGGCPVVIATSEAEDLAALADRVLVMRSGSVAEELTGDISAEEILHAVYARDDEGVLRSA